MTDNKARRVSVRKKYRAGRYVDGKYHVEDDPSGTHMLVPVEVWERVVGAIRMSDESLGEGVHALFRKGIDAPQSRSIWTLIQKIPAEEWASGLRWLKRSLGIDRALEEIGGGDE